MSKSIRFKIAYISLLMLSLINQAQAQPSPSDRGTDPGGGPGAGNHLGAPIDDFIWGLIFFALLYSTFKWYQNKAKLNKFPIEESV